MVAIPKESWSGKIKEIAFGATADEGGTRDKKLLLGGETTLPFLTFEGNVSRPAIGMEVLDHIGEDYPHIIIDEVGDVIKDPVAWARACVEVHGADFICLKLLSTNPEEADVSAEDAAALVSAVLGQVKAPLIIQGSGDYDKDARVMELCGNAAKGERCLLARAEQDGYKSIAVAATANGHDVIAFSNIDVNIAKQLNIMLTEFGVPVDHIVSDPLMAGIGFGMEYAYSAMERIKLAGLVGDKMLQSPMIADVSVAWAAKEAYRVDPKLGDEKKRAVFWEVGSALAALMAGANALILRHPRSVVVVKNVVNDLLG
ncbi:MAG TPA: acetyl-CoA decarbonylase/synthase complex subunit delta [Candidatus Bathyarchaeia archaeon]|nr:acetyl-CoA decarbonylase/synthase complex subunit delta [Candidatus Bathyarchaeia archaeon]